MGTIRRFIRAQHTIQDFDNNDFIEREKIQLSILVLLANLFLANTFFYTREAFSKQKLIPLYQNIPKTVLHILELFLLL